MTAAAPVAVLVALILVALVAFMALRRQAPGERGPLTTMLLAALAVRVIFTLVLDASGAWQVTGRGAVTPDEATVDLAARLLERGDDRSPIVLGGSLHTSWLLLTWAVYELWNNLLAMKLVSAVFGTLLVVPTYLLGRELRSLAAARLAGWGAVVFPPSLVWSALALRETLLALLLTTLVLLAARAPRGSTAGVSGWVAAVVVCLVVLAYTRSYMAPLMAFILVGASVLRRPLRRALASGSLAVVAACAAVAALLLLPAGEQLVRTTVTLVAEPANNIYNPFSDCKEQVDCQAVADPRAAGSEAGKLPGAALGTARGGRPASAPQTATAPGNDLTSSLQSVEQKGLVRAFAIAVLAGRPVWRTTEFFFLLQPGVVVWWTMLPLIALGAFDVARRRRWDAVFATVGYGAAVTVFLAYTGQFIRHHYMFESVGVALAAVGFCTLRGTDGQGASRVLGGTVLAATATMATAAVASVLSSLFAVTTAGTPQPLSTSRKTSVSCQNYSAGRC